MPFLPLSPLLAPGQSKHPSLRQGRLLSRPVTGLTAAVRTKGPKCKRGSGTEGCTYQHRNQAFCTERAGLAWIYREATSPGSRG